MVCTARSIASEISSCSVAVRRLSVDRVVPQPASASTLDRQCERGASQICRAKAKSCGSERETSRQPKASRLPSRDATRTRQPERGRGL